MTHLRFSPREHQALSHVCRPVNLKRCRPAALKRLLVGSLSGDFPELADRIAHMRRGQFLLISDHFRDRERHGLTGEELDLVATAFGRVLLHACFSPTLRPALVEHFRVIVPALAAKLGRLSDDRFETLCARIKERALEPPSTPGV